MGYGFYQFVNGNARKANNPMLWRIGLQGGGVLCLFIGAQVYNGPIMQNWIHSYRTRNERDSLSLPEHKEID